jgi:hypothetical protein
VTPEQADRENAESLREHLRTVSEAELRGLELVVQRLRSIGAPESLLTPVFDELARRGLESSL